MDQVLFESHSKLDLSILKVLGTSKYPSWRKTDGPRPNDVATALLVYSEKVTIFNMLEFPLIMNLMSTY